MNAQIWWFVSRSSGIVAWALLTLAVCWGLFVSTKAVAKASTPAWLLDLHRFLGGLSLLFTGIHLVGLWADSYVEFGWAELFVPMASTWKPGAVAFGVVSFYALVAVQVTSMMMKRLPRRLWRSVHRLSLPLYAIATYHGLASGSDGTNIALRVLSLVSINIVAFLSVLLVLASRKAALAKAETPPRRERTPVPVD